MSTTIDERVVALQFENKDFESGAKESLSTIDKLKNALNFTDAGEGLEAIDRTASSVNFGTMQSALDAVQVKFSVLDQIAMSVLNNIINRVTDTGVNLIKSLSVDQVTAGWNKFAEKTSAVQTIMAATSKDIGTVYKDTNDQMAKVNEQLEKLNWFTDETSYKFVDMTSNIGKFTSNGVALEDAVSSMQGIAVWAARSGANANEASRAMYNLSQALGTGSLMTKDWMSIENANMATYEFKQTVIDTAVEMGKLTKVEEGLWKTTDGTKVSVEGFRESLSSKWITNDILIGSLQKYGNFTQELAKAQDQIQDLLDDAGSAYTLTTASMMDWIDETANGTMKFEELAERTGLSATDLEGILNNLASSEYELGRISFRAAQETKTFQEAIDYVKEAVSSSWMTTFELIFGDYQQAKTLWTGLSETLYEIFVVSGEVRNEILGSWKEHGGQARLFETLTMQAEDLVQIISAIRNGFMSIFGFSFDQADETGRKLAVMTVHLREFYKTIRPTEETLDKLQRTAAGVGAVFHILAQFVGAIAHGFVELFKAILPAGDGILDFTANIGDNLVALDKWISDSKIFTTAVDAIVEVIKNVATVVKSIFDGTIGPVLDGLLSKFKTSEDGTETFLDKLKNLFTVAEDGVSVFQKMGEKIHDIFSGIKTFLQPLIDGVKNLFSELGSRIKNITMSDLWTAMKMVVTGVGASKLFDFIKTLTKGTSSIKDSISGMFNSIGGMFQSFSKQSETVNTPKIRELAETLLILAGAMALLSLVDADRMSSVIAAMGSLLGMLVGVTAAMAAINKKFATTTDSNQGFFGKILGMFGIGNKTNSQMNDLIKIASSILILAIALKAIAGIDPESLDAAVGAITTLMIDMAGMLAAIRLISKINPGESKVTVGQLTQLALAILVMCAPIKLLGDMQPEQLAQGMSAVKTLLIEMGTVLAAMTALSKWSNGTAVKGAGQLLVFSVALLAMCAPIELLGRMPQEAMQQGLIGTGVLMGLMSAVLLAMNKMPQASIESAITNSVQLIVFTNQVLKMIIPIELLGRMSWSDMAQGLVGVGVILAELVTAVTVINKLSQGSVLMAIANAATLMTLTTSIAGLAVVVAGLGILSGGTLAKGLGGLTVIMTELVTALLLLSKVNVASVLASAAAMIVVAGALAILIPEITALGALPFKTLIQGLGGLAAVLGIIAAAGIGISFIAKPILIAAAAVAAFGAALILVGGGLTSLAAGIAALKINELLDGITQTVRRNMPSFLEYFNKFIKAFMDGLVIIVSSASDLVVALCDLLIDCAPKIGQALITLISETLKVLDAEIPEIASVVVDIVLKVLETLAVYSSDLVVKLGEVIVGLIKGLSVALPDIIVAVMDLINSVFEGVIQAFKDFDTDDFLKAGEIIGVISALLVALNLLSPLVPGALAGLAGVTKVIAAVSGVLAAFGLLSYIPGVTELIEGGGELLEAVGVALGKFVGGIVGGIGEGIADSLPQIGKDLTDFATNAAGFIEFASAADGKVVDGVGILADAIMTFTAASFVEAITSFFTGGFDIVDFSAQLIPFGENLSLFSEAVKDVDAEAIEGSANAALAIAALYENLPSDGGFFSIFTGTKDIEQFGDDMVIFGEAIAKFSDAIQGKIDLESVNTAVDAAIKVTSLSDYIQGTGGVVSWFKGDNSFATFGTNLESLGTSLVTFSTTVSSLDHTSIAAAVDSTNLILSVSAEETGENLAALGTNMSLFGQTYGEFAKFMIEASVLDLSAFAVSFADFIAQTTGITEVFTAVTKTIANTLQVMTQAATSMNTAGAKLITELTAGVKSKQNDFNTQIVSIMDEAVKTVNGYEDESKDSGTKLATEFMNAIGTTLVPLNDNLSLAMNSALNVLSEFEDDFKKVGENFVKGIANGISENSHFIYEAAYNAALQAKTAAMLALDEHSPSKEGALIGENFDKGISGGVDDNAKLIYDSSYNAAMESLNAMKDAFGLIQQFVESDIDVNPVITPVLDLSQIQNGSETLDMMLGQQSPMLGFSGNVSFSDPQAGVFSYINDALDKAVATLSDRFEQMDRDAQYTFEIPVTMNGRQVAKASASYTKQELERLDRIESRKNGDL